MKHAFIICLAIFLFALPNKIQAQNEPSFFLNKLCKDSSAGRGESKGVNIEVSVPCAWQQVHDVKGEILKYEYNETNNTGGVYASASLVISNLDTSITGAGARSILTRPKLKLLTRDVDGTYDSFDHFDVDNVHCGEVIIKANANNTYLVEDYLVWQRKLVLIQYTITCPSVKISKAYLKLFRQLVYKTSFE